MHRWQPRRGVDHTPDSEGSREWVGRAQPARPPQVPRVDAGQQTPWGSQQQTADGATARAEQGTGSAVHSRPAHTAGEHGEVGRTSDNAMPAQSLQQRERLIGRHGWPDRRGPSAQTDSVRSGSSVLMQEQHSSAASDAERGTRGCQSTQCGGDVSSQQQTAAADAAPGDTTLLAQLAAALHTARLAGLTASSPSATMVPETGITLRRHGAAFLTVAVLPSGSDQPHSSAAPVSWQGHAHGSKRAPACRSPAQMQPGTPMAVPQDTNAATQQAATPQLCAEDPLSVQDTDVRQQGESTGQPERGSDQPHGSRPPQLAYTLTPANCAANAAAHADELSPPRNEPKAGIKKPAEFGRQPTAPAAVHMRCAHTTLHLRRNAPKTVKSGSHRKWVPGCIA